MTFSATGFRVAAKTLMDIRRIALQTRSALGVVDKDFWPEYVLEQLARYGITVDVTDDFDSELPANVEACWIPDVATMLIRERVYKAACVRESRALFTISHELGHLALAHRRTFNRDASIPKKTYEDSEWQANTFAAEFLMPLDLIRSYDAASADAIRGLFHVSPQAAEIRFEKLRKRNEI